MARQFDIYRMVDGQHVIVMQADVLSDLRTRLVAPLVSENTAPPLRGLTPRLRVGDETYLVMPHLMATLTLAELGQHVGQGGPARDALVQAIDLALTGV